MDPRFLLKQSINFIATTLSVYLLFDDFLYFISKPTYSSNSNAMLQPKNLPDVYLCPEPAFDLDQLIRHGYRSSYEYILGNIKDSKLRGWRGNSSSASVENVLDDVTVIKSPADCPTLMALFENLKDYVNIPLNLTNLVYPQGRCCKAFFPKEASTTSVLKIYFKVMEDDNLPSVEGFQMYLSSQEESHIFKLNNFNTNSPLKSFLSKRGYALYNAKLYEEILLENDPKVQCRNYVEKYGYAEVLTISL